MVKATSLHLARQVKPAEGATAQAHTNWQEARAAQAAFARQSRHPRGRPPDFEVRTQAALGVLVQAERDQAQAQQRQTDARECVRELSALYHPYDLSTGQRQPVAQVAERFRAVWAR